MQSGYIFTNEPALGLVGGAQGVRYAARMADGTGFAAFDRDDPVGAGSTMALTGWIVAVVDPHPDYPPSWPDPWREGPKRHIGVGDEKFAIYARTEVKGLPVPRAAAWVTDGQRVMLLIEAGPEWKTDVEPIWMSDVVEYADARLVSV